MSAQIEARERLLFAKAALDLQSHISFCFGTSPNARRLVSVSRCRRSSLRSRAPAPFCSQQCSPVRSRFLRNASAAAGCGLSRVKQSTPRRSLRVFWMSPSRPSARPGTPPPARPGQPARNDAPGDAEVGRGSQFKLRSNVGDAARYRPFLNPTPVDPYKTSRFSPATARPARATCPATRRPGAPPQCAQKPQANSGQDTVWSRRRLAARLVLKSAHFQRWVLWPLFLGGRGSV